MWECEGEICVVWDEVNGNRRVTIVYSPNMRCALAIHMGVQNTAQHLVYDCYGNYDNDTAFFMHGFSGNYANFNDFFMTIFLWEL